MTKLTTHVLNTTTGQPAPGLGVTLLRSEPEPDGAWGRLAQATTDADGRITDFPELTAGRHRLVFASEPVSGFFPEVVVSFEVDPEREHLHVPLLLSPYGYSVYRGS